MFKEKSYKATKSEYERVEKDQTNGKTQRKEKETKKVKCPDHSEHKRNCINCEA